MRPLLIGLALLMSSSWAAAQEKKEQPTVDKKLRLFPLTEGTKWTYELKQGEETIVADLEVVKVTPGEKKGDRRMALMMTSINGQAEQEELSADDQGVYRHSFMGMPVETPVQILKYPYKAGSKWTQKVKVGDEQVELSYEAFAPEEVKVKAGTYKGYPVLVTLTAKDKKVVKKVWYADGVGPVRQEGEADGKKFTIELTKFGNEISAETRQ